MVAAKGNSPATSTQGRTAKAAWNFKPGDNVVILPDNDQADHDHANAVAGYLKQVQVYALVLDLPRLGPKGDVVEWADAGGTAEQLLALIERDARPWVPSNGHDEAPGLGMGAGEGADVASFRATVLFSVTTNIAELEMEQIVWLWPGWLAKGKLHLIAGAPEAGKTTIGLSFAAAISAGNYWPGGKRAPVGNVLIWTSEDNLKDTIKPRLVQMGADLSRVDAVTHQFDGKGKLRPFNPATDMPSLAEKARCTPGGVAFLMIDPIVAAIPLTRNSHNNAETRNGMQPVVDFAEATGAAVFGITHFTKGTDGKDPVERVTGSLAFGALPRVVLAAAKKTDDEPPRILVRAKSNIGLSGGGFGYDIIAAPLYERPDIIATRIAWHDAIEGTAKELLGDAEGSDEDDKTSKVAEAMAFLKAVLGKGERLQREIVAEATAAGISEITLRRAAKGTVGKRKTALGWYWWSLP